MNAMIKILEDIGQSVSLKQFDNPLQLLNSVNVSDNIIEDLRKHTIEYVCAVMPEDDDDNDERINI